MQLSISQQDKLQKCMDMLDDDKQITKAIEELAELIQATCKYTLRPNPEEHEHIIEEMADVFIVMHEMKDIFNISDEQINKVAQKKIDRLYDRLYGV